MRRPLESKLPHVGTTIFTVMSALAAEHQAINLSQGFPDYDGPAALKERVRHYLDAGFNQYPPMAGVAELRQAIAAKVRAFYGAEVCPDTEVTVTPGATEAIYCAVTAVCRSGDEVILFDPAYDSYEPAVTLAGARPVRLTLRPPDYRIDWQQVAARITPRTRMIMVNSPHNPTGTLLDASDMEALESLAARHDLIVCADEVYEHLVYDGARHESVLRYPALAARAFAVFSFGKTYHVTGWKTGYCVAPADLTRELRRVHQFVTFVGVTPIQRGLADFMQAHPEHLEGLPAFYQRKRDLFIAALEGSRFRLLPSRGTFFQLADYSAISALPDVEFARWLTIEKGVAAIPLSVFHAEPPDSRYVRFCFCKEDDTLRRGAARLAALWCRRAGQPGRALPAGAPARIQCAHPPGSEPRDRRPRLLLHLPGSGRRDAAGPGPGRGASCGLRQRAAGAHVGVPLAGRGGAGGRDAAHDQDHAQRLPGAAGGAARSASV